MTERLVTASADSYFLAEGPLWDPIRRRLLWVDIENGHAYSGRLDADGTIADTDRFELGATAGAVGVSAAGDWIIAGTECLFFRSSEGVLTPGPRIIEEGSRRRLNDGKADPAGRYLVGTMSLDGPSESEELVSLDIDGSVRTIDEDLTLSNGLAWRADGRVLYSVDTLRQAVFQRTYVPETGETGRRSVFRTFDSGFPDGMTIDAEDHLWIAVWGLGQVRRYAPDGRLDATIRIPAPHTSSVAFAGPGLDTLVITTARQGLTESELAAHPLSGRIFTVKPGVAGRPQPLWSGLRLPVPLPAIHQ